MHRPARPRRLAPFFAAALLLAAPAVAQQQRGGDPDWPCQQRLVPQITAGSLWSGPPLDGAGDWRSDERVKALVEKIAPRRVDAEKGEAAIEQFAQSIGGEPDRARLLTLAFAGLLEETNRERSALIGRLKDIGHRQRELADIASNASEELGRIPADATGEEAARRTDLEERFRYVTRAFDGGRQTIRYACDAPVQLEARLGRYARALQAHLS
jgi:hypothetical protein